MIVSGYAGIGKTCLGNKYKEVIDLESISYKWVIDENNIDIEHSKGLKNKPENPEWPNNYVNDILEKNKQYKIVLISPNPDVLEILQEKSVDVLIVVPDPNTKNEYLARYRDRGNNEAFIKAIDGSFEYYISYLIEKNHRVIILKSGEYLEDILLKNGYL